MRRPSCGCLRRPGHPRLELRPVVVTLSGPCGWDVEPCDDCSVEVTPAHEAIAVDMLWRLTHSRFGPCEVTVRPCSDPSVSCGRCGGQASGSRRCGCRAVPEIVLPGPVYSISEVWVDGERLDDNAFRVDDRAWLVRIDGGVWPFCQDLTADFDGAGAFTVIYKIGVPPPTGAAEMAGELACDIARALCNDKGCRLPKRISQKVRAGVTVTFKDLTEGKTGIDIVDMWLDSANRRSRRPRVYSPDLPHVRETTWEAGDGGGSGS